MLTGIIIEINDEPMQKEEEAGIKNTVKLIQKNCLVQLKEHAEKAKIMEKNNMLRFVAD